jgi:inorganic pyrophosphatase
MKQNLIVIETPKGSCAKYKYDPKRKRFALTKTLPLGMHFPYDFGFIPRTEGEDGDPLDAMILSEIPFSPAPPLIAGSLVLYSQNNLPTKVRFEMTGFSLSRKTL